MKTKEYLIKNFIPIAKEEAMGLSNVIECLESIEHYLSSQLEAQVKPANGDILKTINEFFEDYLLDKDKCFYIDSLKFKNNLHFATLIIRQLKIDLLSRLSV